MANNADAASGTVSMVTEMQGKIFKVSADIAGDLSKDVLRLMFLIISNNNRTAAQKKIYEMIRSGEGFKCIEMRIDGIRQFSELARREGLDYNAVEDISAGAVRILFKTSDVEKVNRILDRMPATVKLTGDAVVQNFEVREQPRDEYMAQAMGVYETETNTKEDVTVARGSDDDMPSRFIETVMSRMGEKDGERFFTSADPSTEKGSLSSTETLLPQERPLQEDPEKADRNMSVLDLFSNGRRSVLAQLDDKDHDLAGNDRIAELVPEKDITESVSR